MVFQFDSIKVINLKRRPDRLKEFWDEFNQIDNWPFEKRPEVVDAIDGRLCPQPFGYQQGPYVWGCFQSHRKAIQEALNDGADSVLIFEDDVHFVERFGEKCEQFFADIPDDWDWAWLGHHHMQVPYPVKPGITRSKHMDRMHAYGVRGRALRDLYRYWHQWHEHHCDWAISEWIRQFNSYCVEPWICGQRSGYSDLLFKEVPADWWNKRSPLSVDRSPVEGYASDRASKIFAGVPCPYRGKQLPAKNEALVNIGFIPPAYQCLHPLNTYKRCFPWKNSPSQKTPACDRCTWDKSGVQYPRFSACMPTRGRPDRAIQSIDSFFATTHGFDVEMCVVSHPDETVDRLQQYAEANPQYRLTFEVADCGAIDGWNKAAAMATGFFLKVWDDDLVAQPHWLRAAINKWQSIGRPQVAYFGLWDDDVRVPDKLFTRAFGTRAFFVEVLGGVLCVPAYARWWDDNEKFDRAVAAGCAHACMESRIVHYQAAKGAGPWDETAVLGRERGKKDLETYLTRRAAGFPTDYEPVFGELDLPIVADLPMTVRTLRQGSPVAVNG